MTSKRGAVQPVVERETPPPGPVLVRAAEGADHEASVARAASRRAQRWLDQLASQLPALFVSKRVAELRGLPGEIVGLLRGVGRIELATLDGDDKVRIVDGVLRVHRDYPEMLARRRVRDGDKRTALYLAHEVAHLVQGIGSKRRVVELRAAEGEDTLLHLDLAADHAAAVVASAVLGVSLEDLKRRTLTMLEDFPVGLDHSPGAALRKSRRAVAIAADIVARWLGLVRGEDRYAYVFWQRGGEVAILMARGAFDQCVTTFPIEARDAALFDAAAGAQGSTRSVMTAMERLLRARCARG